MDTKNYIPENGSPNEDAEISGDLMDLELCGKAPCLGTPGDIAKLIKAGYAGVLRKIMAVVMIQSDEKKEAPQMLPMVQIAAYWSGCPMYKDGKCLLAESGLTPQMGKVHLMTGGLPHEKLRQLLFLVTLRSWMEPDNRSLVGFCLDSMDKINSDLECNQTN